MIFKNVDGAWVLSIDPSPESVFILLLIVLTIYIFVVRGIQQARQNLHSQSSSEDNNS